MVHKRLSLVLIATLCPVAGWTAGAWHRSMSARLRPVCANTSDTPPPQSPASGWSALPTPLIDDSPRDDDRRDLYGNEVSPAIARYTHDDAGAVREEHSPTTDVTRLRPPTT